MANRENGIFLRSGEQIWRCLHCGKTLVGGKAPETCPICGKLNSFFRVEPEKY